MIISIDYDGTWSADPRLFTAFVVTARQHGHTILMITQRGPEWRVPEMDVIEAVISHPIIFAAGKTKVDAATDAGFNVDIWIDDNPYAMVKPFTYTGPDQGGY